MTPPTVSECVIELEGRHGKMRIQWRGMTAADLAQLSRMIIEQADSDHAADEDSGRDRIRGRAHRSFLWDELVRRRARGRIGTGANMELCRAGIDLRTARGCAPTARCFCMTLFACLHEPDTP